MRINRKINKQGSMIMSFKMHCTGEAILENNLTRRTGRE